MTNGWSLLYHKSLSIPAPLPGPTPTPSSSSTTHHGLECCLLNLKVIMFNTTRDSDCPTGIITLSIPFTYYYQLICPCFQTHGPVVVVVVVVVVMVVVAGGGGGRGRE